MYDQSFKNYLNSTLTEIKEAGLYKQERLIDSMQDSTVRLKDGREVINLCANNYLGLADNAHLIQAAHQGLDRWGYGVASVRFICGTQSLHTDLEAAISRYLGTEDTILYTSCFDANGGLFETLLSEQDAVISDELNHASIIDGIRLCKSKRYRYKNNNLSELEQRLQEADQANARFKLVVTDGVFSMDGIIADLKGISELTQKYKAILVVDDSHAVGFLGKTGRGTPEYCGVRDRVDLITGTLGKALGGASGGYTSGRKEIIEVLRQRSRPYLFSNSLAPTIAAASLACIQMLEADTSLRDKLEENTKYYREKMSALGFTILGANHPICPVLLGDAKLAQAVSSKLLEKGVYAVGFFYPVVPKDRARIRTQVSAAHSREQLDFAVQAFREVKQELSIF
jgi:glycine C-acetyltransferase